MRSLQFPRSLSTIQQKSSCYSSSTNLVLAQRSFFGFFKKKPAPGDSQTGGAGDTSSSPSSSFPGMPSMPKQPNPLGVAKDIWNITKAAKQMSKEANPEGGLKGMTESQMAQFRAVLELQKKVAAEVGTNGKMDNTAMGKMFAQSSDMFEKMLGPMEKLVQDKKQNPEAPSTKEIGENALKGMTHLPPSRGMAHKQDFQQNVSGTSAAPSTSAAAPATPKKNTPTPPASTTTKSTATPNNNTTSGGGLSPEIEALFSELREMRAKRNFYRDKFQDADKELSTAKTSIKTAQLSETDLRKRLSQAEHTVALLQSESLELRDVKKDLTGQLKKANTELTKSRPTTTTLVEAQKNLESDLLVTKKQNSDLQKDVARLERKISRLRKHSSPISDLSELLTEVSRVASDRELKLPISWKTDSAEFLTTQIDAQDSDEGVSSVASLDNTSAATATSSSTNSSSSSTAPLLSSIFRNSVADDAFNTVRDKYEQLTALRFEQEDSKNCGVHNAIVEVASEFIRARIPHSLLDCIITTTDAAVVKDVEWALEERNTKCKDLLGGCGGIWSIKITPPSATSTPNATTITITAAPDADTPTSGLGPFGLFATFLASKAALAASASSGNSSSPTSIHPTISTPLVNNARRAKIVTDKARSSKPGGQAANVGETKITHRLVVDGTLITSATSQDSRSAMHNIDTAMERLMTERLPVANQKLKYLPQLKLLVTSGTTSTTASASASATTSTASNNNNSGDVATSNSSSSSLSPALLLMLPSSLKSSVQLIEEECGEAVAESVKFALISTNFNKNNSNNNNSSE